MHLWVATQDRGIKFGDSKQAESAGDNELVMRALASLYRPSAFCEYDSTLAVGRKDAAPLSERWAAWQTAKGKAAMEAAVAAATSALHSDSSNGTPSSTSATAATTAGPLVVAGGVLGLTGQDAICQAV